MPTITSDARFLGVDLRALGRDVRQAWSDVQDVPPLSWLTPEASVLLLQADGGESLWWGAERRASGSKAAGARFTALELPEDLLLRRTLTVPAMSEADTASAVALQVRAISPFAEHDLVWGYRTQLRVEGSTQLDIALASRKQIAQYMQTQAARVGTAAAEVWATLPTGAPIVFLGYGEGARRARGARGRWVRYGLLALALALVGGIAITPTLQLRARAIEAVRAYDAAALRTPPLVKEREALMQSVEKLGALSELLAGRIEPLRVLDRLTKVLPDDTALQGFTLKGQKVTLNGLTANASALMQVLGEQPGVRDVRAPNPATRVGGPNSKENFVVEFTLDPQEFGVATAQPSAPQPVAPVPMQAPAPAPTASASAPPPAAKALAPAPAPTSAAAGALVPVFGGAAMQSAPPPVKPASAKPERKGNP